MAENRNQEELERKRAALERVGLQAPGGNLGDRFARTMDIWGLGKANAPQTPAEPDLYEPDASSVANFQKKYAYLKALADQAPTYSAQAPYLNEMYGMYEDLYPGRSTRLGELSSLGIGGDQLGQMAGLGGDYLQNQSSLNRFIGEMGQGSENEDINALYENLIAQAMTNPELAGQYYGEDSNPNIIQKLGARVESLSPNKTYDETLRERRLERSGFDF